MMSPAEVLIGVVALGELAVKLRAAVEEGAPAELIEALSASRRVWSAPALMFMLPPRAALWRPMTCASSAR